AVQAWGGCRPRGVRGFPRPEQDLLRIDELERNPLRGAEARRGGSGRVVAGAARRRWRAPWLRPRGPPRRRGGGGDVVPVAPERMTRAARSGPVGTAERTSGSNQQEAVSVVAL